MFKKLLICLLPVIFIISYCFVSIEKSFAKSDKQIAVYYFYGKPRCSTCKKIEKYTREAVSENFSKEIKSGKVYFQSIDMDKPENKHFVEKYKLYTKAVIISEKIKGKEVKYKNLDKIWTLVNNEKIFKSYIKKEIKSFLEE